MVSAIKRISIGKGYDPREFTLVACGGAGPMHACAIADALGIKRIIIPPFAGAFSAFGIMSAPIRTDYVRTILRPLDKALDTIPAVLEEFNSDLGDKLGEQFQNAISRLSMDMRYFGQGHEINIPLSDEVTQKNIQAIAEVFHKRHRTLFGFDIIDNPIEVVNIKMVAELPIQELPLRQFQKSSLEERGRRDVYPEKDVSIYRRDFHGASINGPCIIEDDTTTVNVPSSWLVSLDLNDILKLECES